MSQRASVPPATEGSVTLESGFEALQTGPEFRGPVESLDGHPCNDHFAQIYETSEEKFAASVPFVRHGLERGERVMYVVDESTEAEVRREMRDAGVAVDAAVESGALSFHTVQETYLRTGAFDVDEMLDFYGTTVADATEEHEALRIVAETTWLEDDETSIEQFMEYEQKINDLFDRTDSLAICQYNRERFAPETIRDVVRTHPHLIYDGAVCHNVYYTPPEEFFGDDAPARENERMLRTLRDRTVAKSELRRRERSLEDLYEITADPTQSFESKVRRLLELGRERFDLDIGYFTRTTDDAFEVVEAVGSHELIAPGATGTLSDSYCAKLLASPGPVAVRDATEAGWIGDPAYETYGLDAYFAATVHVGGDDYGTLCFASESPRDRPYTDAERTFLDLMVQWVEYELDREYRETRLHALNEISRELLDAETPDEIATGVVDSVENAFEDSIGAVALYDEETGELRPAAHTAAAAELVEAAGLFERGEGAAWRAFVEGEPARVTDPLDRGASPSERLSVSEAVVHPLGTHAVYVVGARGPGGFRSGDLEVIETAAANIRAAHARTDRERKLQKREDALEEQNETLTRVNRINDTIRSIDRGLVETSTREAVERVVCEEFALTGPYELAWIGDADGMTGEITPREAAGSGTGYLDGITVTADDTPTGNGPAGRAFETGEPQVVNDVLTDESFGPWRQNALNRGYHATAAFPLCYNGTRYGVLNLYAGQPGVFDDLEREVLTELSNTVAHAINAIESKKALLSDEITELEFSVADDNYEIAEMVRALDCEFSLKRLVPRTDGGVRSFFSVSGASTADVLGFESRLPFSELRVVADADDGSPGVFEATLTDESLATAVLDHGGRLRRIEAAEGTASVTVRLAADAAVREFVEMFRSKYPDSELRAQRSTELTERTPLEFAAELVDDLTDRQREVIQTAYYNGYFEQPRTRTGTDIADAMGISQPTFHSHVRTAVRKLCRAVFEDEATVG